MLINVITVTVFFFALVMSGAMVITFTESISNRKNKSFGPQLLVVCSLWTLFYYLTCVYV